MTISSDTQSSHLSTFTQKFPDLDATLHTLTTNNITWAIGGSGALYLLGNERIPDDVDIYVADEHHDLVDALFGCTSFYYTSPLEHVRNSNPGGDHDLQITSDLQITANGITYHWKLDEEVLGQSIIVGTMRLIPVEDVLLIKALLQRGQDLGKHDIEDIRAFEQVYTLDKAYLQRRIATLGAQERVRSVWQEML